MEDHFDVAVLGTGLPEAMIAAALAKKGFSVLQVDEEPFYGGTWAALSLEEAISWAEARRLPSGARSAYAKRQQELFSDVSYSLGNGGPTASSSSTTLSPELRKKSRQYSLPITPTLVPSTSAFVDTLVASGVSNYVNFRLLEGIGVYEKAEGGGKGKVRRVPASKEDVFKDASLGLVEKRRLMKFLMWAGAGEWDTEESRAALAETPFESFLTSAPHSLSPRLASFITSLSLSPLPTSPTLPPLVRLRQTILSLGKFGNSPFLIGQYGGSGEAVGGFARSAAVKGAVQVVGRAIGVERDGSEGKQWKVRLGDSDGEGKHEALVFTVGRIIASSDYLDLFPNLARPPPSTPAPWIARAIVVLSGPVNLLDSTPSQTEQDPTEDGSTERSEPERLPPSPENVLVVFPSKSLAPEQTNAVTALLLGEGAMACPTGERALCLSTIDSEALGPQTLLRPALDAILSLSSASPLFSLFFSAASPSQPATTADDLFIVPPIEDGGVLTVSSDRAAQLADEVVRKVTGDAVVWEKDAVGSNEMEEDD